MKAAASQSVSVPPLLSLCEDSRSVLPPSCPILYLILLLLFPSNLDFTLPLCWQSCSVVGTPFYLMKYVPGRVFKNPALTELGPEERAAYYWAMCRTLAAIHSVDLQKADLMDFGKEGE